MIIKTTKTQIGSVIPKATSGSIPYIDSFSKLAQDNANFHYDAVNNRVGIGNNTPEAILSIGDNLNIPYLSGNNIVVGDSNTSQNGGIYVGQDGTHNLGFNWIASATPANAIAQLFTYGFSNDIKISSKNLLFYQGGTMKGILTSSGNFGLGLGNPATKLQIGSAFTPTSETLVALKNSGKNTYIQIAQDNSHSLFFGWKYNAPVSNAFGWIVTYGYYNDLKIDGKNIIMQTQQTPTTGNVGIGGTPNANAKLDIQSTTRAFLPPRMTTAQKNAIASPTAGMVVYDTTLNKLALYTTIWEDITSV